MSRSSFQAEISQIRESLLGYVARLGVRDTESQRTLAAHLWRGLPRGLAAANAVLELDDRIAAWGTAILGRKVSAAQIRLAMLETDADPMDLLSHEASRQIIFAAKISPALVQVTPIDTPVVMPVQSLRPIFFRVPASAVADKSASRTAGV